MMNFHVHYGLYSYNQFENVSDGREGVVFHEASNILVENNEVSNQRNPGGQADGQGFAAKSAGAGETSNNIIFRYNYVHDCKNKGLEAINESNYIYMYGNLCMGNGAGIVLAVQQYNLDHIYVWSNIVTNSINSGIDLAHYAPPGDISYAYIYNNTIVGNGTNPTDGTQAGLRHESGSNIYVGNNIFENNRTMGGGDQEIWNGNSGLYLDNNQYFSSSSPVLTGISEEGNAYVGNPEFTGGNSYTLQSGSPAIGAGTAQSGCFSVNLSNGDSWFEKYSGYRTISMCYGDALDPASNWDTTPPTVITAKQGTDGGWERGAYVYGTGSGSMNIASPTGLKILLQ
jgi:Right handed beta helix region